jgi:hypothetical protein
MDDLKGIRSLIVPLFFVPMGRLKDEQWFKDAEMTALHKELLTKCLEHGFRWTDDLIRLSFSGRWYEHLIQPFYRFFVGVAKYKVKRAGIRYES